MSVPINYQILHAKYTISLLPAFTISKDLNVVAAALGVCWVGEWVASWCHGGVIVGDGDRDHVLSGVLCGLLLIQLLDIVRNNNAAVFRGV